ncbi:MAG: site-specific integrase [Methylocystaceae bacterium]|nr:site-specific integrase [Methylocystaceae bacterium]
MFSSFRERIQARKVPLLTDLSRSTYADYLKPMVLLSLYTGMRRGEVFNLKWTDINFERHLLTVQGGGAKSGKTRHIPLNDNALQLLKDWQAQCNRSIELVFTNKDGQKFDHIKTSWKGVLKKAEIRDFRWHDLRHTFASWLVMESVDLNTVRELLGHSELQMTLRYAHLAPEHKAQAVGRLSF